MKNVHDVGVCDLPTCKIGLFFNSLYSYIRNSRRSQRLLRKIIYYLCKKYPNSFNDSFNITRISTFYILVKLRNRKKKENGNCSELVKKRDVVVKKKKKKKKTQNFYSMQQLLHNLVEIERERVKLDKKFQ